MPFELIDCLNDLTIAVDNLNITAFNVYLDTLLFPHTNRVFQLHIFVKGSDFLP